MARKSYKSVKRVLNIYKDLPVKVLRETVKEIGLELVDISPVGNPALWKRKAPKNYKAGHFVKNWQPTIGSPATNELAGQDKSKRFTKAAVKKVAKNWNGENSFYLTNNAPYATALEYGWSTQAPKGMVRITATKYRAIINQSMAEARKESGL